MSLPSAPETFPSPTASPATQRDEALRRIADRLDRVPSVARRTSGPSGLAVAYLPGQRLPGLRVRDGRLEVHVVMAWPATVDDVALDVALAVDDLWDPCRVDLMIDDVALPPGGRPNPPLPLPPLSR